MPLDNVTWYARIGVFKLTMLKWLLSCYFKPTLNSYNFTNLLSAWILFLSFCNIAVNVSLTICGLLGVSSCLSASSLGPKTKNQISFCHWNLNSLAAHNFTKISLLQALSVTHDYYIICLSKTFLDLSISNDDKRINI